MRWWRRAEEEVAPAGVSLGWDVHSHLVPGVDDGAATLEEGLVLVEGLVRHGYRGAVVTPHVHSDLYPNSRTTLVEPFARLEAAAARQFPGFQLRLAAEYLIDERFERLVQEGDLLDFEGVDAGGQRARCVLVELGFAAMPPQAERVLFDLERIGYVPVLAHIERYPYLDLRTALRFAERGALLTVNAASLAGAYGPQVQTFARTVVKGGHAAALCSDAHGMRHIDCLPAAVALPEVRKALQTGGFPLHRHLGT